MLLPPLNQSGTSELSQVVYDSQRNEDMKKMVAKSLTWEFFFLPFSMFKIVIKSKLYGHNQQSTLGQAKYTLLKFICSKGCVSSGFPTPSEGRFKCRPHASTSSVFSFSYFNNQKEKYEFQFKVHPPHCSLWRELWKLGPTVCTLPFAHCLWNPLSMVVHTYILVCSLWCRSVCQFPLFLAPRGSAAPKADWCRSRCLYVNSRRMLAETQKRVVVQHFLLFVSHSPLRWSSLGTIRAHHFPIKCLNDLWLAPWLILHNGGRGLPCLVRTIVLV